MITLSKGQLATIIKLFFEYAQEKRFTLDKELAKKDRSYRFILGPQVSIIKEMLEAVFMKRRTTMNISIVRQFGKTEVCACLLAFLFETYYEYMGEGLRVAVISPDKNTGLEIFERALGYLPEGFFSGTRYHKKDPNGNKFDVHSIYDDGKGGTIEGRTYDIIMRDEAHLGDDLKFVDQVLPTTIRTSGLIVNIGNGGYRDCYYYQRLLDGDMIYEKSNTKNVVIKRGFPELEDYMTGLAKEGIIDAQVWLDGIFQYVHENGGWESYEVRKNILCEWILEYGNYVTIEDLSRCKKDLFWDDETELFVSIDWGRVGDRTIATFSTGDYHIVDWLIVKDSNEKMSFQDQCAHFRDHCDLKGYTKNIAAIASDSTGLGEGASEFLEIEMECQILPYKFTSQWKHKTYTHLRDRVITTDGEARLSYNKSHPLCPMFEKEMTTIEVTANKIGLLSFSAPQRVGFYDDFVAGAAMVMDLISKQSGYARDAIPMSSRFETIQTMDRRNYSYRSAKLSSLAGKY